MPTTKKEEGILVVDDEEPIREIISAMLSTGGYQRRKTASGLEASGEKFVLMLSGLFELCEADMVKHARKRSPDMPMVFITATYDMSLKQSETREARKEELNGQSIRSMISASFGGALAMRIWACSLAAIFVAVFGLAQPQQQPPVTTNSPSAGATTAEAFGLLIFRLVRYLRRPQKEK